MSAFYSHVNTAEAVLTSYKGEVPLSIFLKGFFAKDKKYGSRDRKAISALCYNYFRLGKACSNGSVHDKIITSYFLFNNTATDWLQTEKPEWNAAVTKPLVEKLAIAQLDLNTIFPFNNELSIEIDRAAFNASFLAQPKLFIRIRPGKHFVVKKKLLTAGAIFEEIAKDCLAFTNGTKLESILEINKDVVIQDYNSQRVGEFFPVEELPKPVNIWDCCAASGGKSILCYDLIAAAKLTVSDVRPSIIHNLQIRLGEAGVKEYHSFVCDVTNADTVTSSLKKETFDLVICDAPCSGSGTWARTPEQLLFFKQAEIERYSHLQKSIAKNAAQQVKKDGYFLYITCSVFAKENEEVVAFIREQPGFTLQKMAYLKGDALKADTMFLALFKRNSL